MFALTRVLGFYERTWQSGIARPLWALRIWLHCHPVWARILAVVVVDLYIVVFGNTIAAHAADPSPVPFLPGLTITDSAGIPISHYAVLPIDRGDWLNTGKSILAAMTDPIWTGHLAALSWLIWVYEQILTFAWLDMLIIPFQALADLMQDFFGKLYWIPLALAIAGAIGGFAIALGRFAAGFSEMLIAAFISVLAVTSLANPVTTITAAGGAFDTAQDYGTQLSAAVVAGDINAGETPPENIADGVTGQLVNIFVRIPAQTIAFGQVLEGECADKFDQLMLEKPPLIDQSAVRDGVRSCNESAKQYNENPNFGQVLTTGIIASGSTGSFLVPIILMGLFMFTAFGTLLSGVKTIFHVHAAILPMFRAALWRSVSDMAVGVIGIVFLCVGLATSLVLTGSVMTWLIDVGYSLVAQMLSVDMVMIIALIFLVRMKRRAKRGGRRMADQLARLGVAGSAPKPQTGMKAMAVAGMASHVLASALKRPPQTTSIDARSLHFGVGAVAGGGSEGGPMNLTQVRPPTPPQPALPGSSRLAITDGRDGDAFGGTPSTPPPDGRGPLDRAGRLAAAAGVAVRVARGLPGGAAGVATAAAKEVGGAVIRKGAQKAAQAASSGRAGASPAPAGPSASRLGEGGGWSGQTLTVHERPRIEVGENGQGRFRKEPARQVIDISSLAPAPRPDTAQRREAMKARLAAMRAA